MPPAACGRVRPLFHDLTAQLDFSLGTTTLPSAETDLWTSIVQFRLSMFCLSDVQVAGRKETGWRKGFALPDVLGLALARQPRRQLPIRPTGNDGDLLLYSLGNTI